MEPGRPLTARSQTVVEASRLHRARERKLRGDTLIEGPHVLGEAIRARADVKSVFALAGGEVPGDFDVIPVEPRALERIAGTETPRGPVAVIGIPSPRDEPRPGRLLVSWGVSDPGNVGTMIRTAAAFGWGFAYSEGTADPWSPKVLRAGAGLQFATWIGPVESVEDLRESGHSPIASVVDGGRHPSNLDVNRVALLIGEEASGLPDRVVSTCDAQVTIPMPGGSESLNAAIAAGILVYSLSNHSGEGEVGV